MFDRSEQDHKLLFQHLQLLDFVQILLHHRAQSLSHQPHLARGHSRHKLHFIKSLLDWFVELSPLRLTFLLFRKLHVLNRIREDGLQAGLLVDDPALYQEVQNGLLDHELDFLSLLDHFLVKNEPV